MKLSYIINNKLNYLKWSKKIRNRERVKSKKDKKIKNFKEDINYVQTVKLSSIFINVYVASAVIFTT
jgi:hypothetical protein